MLTDYAESEANVLLSEGGYTNDPQDPGGPTNWGITIYDARLYWKHDATAADVRAMPKSVAQEIYKKKYWDALDCDQLPAGLDYSVFDYGVNSGIGRPGRVLRQLVGMPATDWHITADVIAAVGKHNEAELIEAINDERLAFLKRLRTWSTFGTGWSRRVASVRKISLAMNKRSLGVTTPLPLVPPGPPVAKGVDHPNDLVPPAMPTSTRPVAFEGFCIRGLLSIFVSHAMENLTDEINAKHPGTMTVSDHGWWFSYFSNVGWLTQQCRSIYLNHKKVVLIGHSFGANAALRVAQTLNNQDVEVELLCPIDPAAQYPADLVVPSNVKRVVAFYQTTPGELGEGVVRPGPGWSKADWDARVDDDHRVEGHLEIADDPFVHNEILQAIKEMVS